MNKISFKRCPYCNAKDFDECVNEIVNEFDIPYIVVECYCPKCHKYWTSYYSQEEIKFGEEEKIYSNCLSNEDKEILLNAIDLLIEKENDTKDYSNIIKIMKGGLVRI